MRTTIFELGIDFLHASNLCLREQTRKFTCFFGPRSVAIKCWKLLVEKYSREALSEEYLLYALYYLKRNPTNDEAAHFFNHHRQTYTYKHDIYVEMIASLYVVRQSSCLLSIFI